MKKHCVDVQIVPESYENHEKNYFKDIATTKTKKRTFALRQEKELDNIYRKAIKQRRKIHV